MDHALFNDSSHLILALEAGRLLARLKVDVDEIRIHVTSSDRLDDGDNHRITVRFLEI